MPGMEMYSREDIEKMQDQLGAHQKKEEEQEVMDSEGNLFHGEEIGFFQTVMNALAWLWSWIKGIFGFRKGTSEEL